MKIYFYLDGEDFAEIEGPFVEALEQWLTSQELEGSLVNEKQGDPDFPDSWRLGLDLTLTKKAQLKAPLNFLYSQAKTHKQDFVIGIAHDSGEMENICYFGNEEGRPDMFEVSCYLGMEK